MQKKKKKWTSFQLSNSKVIQTSMEICTQTEFHTDTATYIQMYVYTQDSIVWYFLHPLGP